MCLATGSTSASFNPAFTRCEVTEPRAALDAAQAAYGAAGLPWLLKLHPDADRRVVQHAQDRGVVFEAQPLLALRLHEAATDEWPHDALDIVPADTGNIADA